MDLSERIKKVIEHYKLSVRRFAIKCGMTQATMDRQVKGINAVSVDTLQRIISNFQDVSPEWLLIGEGFMLKEQNVTKDTERLNSLLDTISTLQEAINAKNETISLLKEKITQLETQLKSK